MMWVLIKAPQSSASNEYHIKAPQRSASNEYHNIYVFMEKSEKYQGRVVQSVISLTSSLRFISLTVLADSIFNILIFFAEKL